MSNSQRLTNRIYIISNLDFLIKESIYHRNHAEEFEKYNPFPIGNINSHELKAKIL